eukprot:scaffold68094_cov39-Phaeocystis_antarctica.AAC.1
MVLEDTVARPEHSLAPRAAARQTVLVDDPADELELTMCCDIDSGESHAPTSRPTMSRTGCS